ncbi:MAG: hypothetical protein U0270_35220 [Labilithrix sp.]
MLTAGGIAFADPGAETLGSSFAVAGVEACGGADGRGVEVPGGDGVVETLVGGKDGGASTASSPTSTYSSSLDNAVMGGSGGSGGGADRIDRGGGGGGPDTRAGAGPEARGGDGTGDGDSVERRALSSELRTRSSKSIASASDGREISLSDSSDNATPLARARFSPRHVRQATVTALFVAASAGCASRATVETPSPPPSTVADAALPSSTSPLDAGAIEDAAIVDAGAPTLELHPLDKEAIDGPHEEMSLDAGRPVWYALPKREAGAPPLRLVGHLHGVCGGPPYACGKWIGSGTAAGVMVCPTGNAHCGESPYSPPSWEAATWGELVGLMDQDLETSIAKVGAKKKGAFTREGAILTGYSRGAYAAPQIARSHPNRWRHLVLIEANVPLSVAGLKAAGVRSVALVAGEQGDQIPGMRKTEAALEGESYPVKLFVMKKTGHPYSADMEDVMAAALTFVLQHDD